MATELSKSQDPKISCLGFQLLSYTNLFTGSLDEALKYADEAVTKCTHVKMYIVLNFCNIYIYIYKFAYFYMYAYFCVQIYWFT